MFTNIGNKIKMLAKIICWIGIICSVIGGIIVIFTFSQSQQMTIWGILIGLGVIIVGALISWIGSFVLYGYGELIQTNIDSEKRLEALEQNSRITNQILANLSGKGGNPMGSAPMGGAGPKSSGPMPTGGAAPKSSASMPTGAAPISSNLMKGSGAASVSSENASSMPQSGAASDSASPVGFIFCPECGSKMRADRDVCYNCGRKLR